MVVIVIKKEIDKLGKIVVDLIVVIVEILVIIKAIIYDSKVMINDLEDFDEKLQVV